MRSNLVVNRTRNGIPRLGLISFWPKRRLPLRAGYRERLGRTTMLNTRSLFITVAGLVATVSGVEAAPMNKCVVNGTVTFQQGPCPSNQVRKDPTIEELNAAEKTRRAAAASAAAATPRDTPPAPTAKPSSFTCDGRQYCSQMRSCEEAKYFLANCPGVKMDGDRNGIPCEKQWCSR